MADLITEPHDGHGPEDTCPGCPHTPEEQPRATLSAETAILMEVGGRIGKWVANGSLSGHYDVLALLEQIKTSRWMTENLRWMAEIDRSGRAYGFEVGRGHPLTEVIEQTSDDNPFMDPDWRDHIEEREPLRPNFEKFPGVVRSGAQCEHLYPPANSDGTCPSCGRPRATEDEPATVWVVTWENYIHGVFSTTEEAHAYADWRWPRPNRYGLRIQEQTLDAGWSPSAGEWVSLASLREEGS